MSGYLPWMIYRDFFNIFRSTLCFESGVQYIYRKRGVLLRYLEGSAFLLHVERVLPARVLNNSCFYKKKEG